MAVTSGDVLVEVTGEGAGQVPTDESHLVVRALRATCDALGVSLPGVTLRCRNAIPHARGLGSSAAAIVAGVAAAYGLAGKTPDDGALQVAAEFEGHADNAGARPLRRTGPRLVGGVAVPRAAAAGRARRALAPGGARPRTRGATSVTRGLLPERVPHTDAAFAGRPVRAGRAGVHRPPPDLLLPATEDRLHQDYRESAWPQTMRMVRELRENGVAATVSGAGPTVFAVSADGRLPNGIDTKRASRSTRCRSTGWASRFIRMCRTEQTAGRECCVS